MSDNLSLANFVEPSETAAPTEDVATPEAENQEVVDNQTAESSQETQETREPEWWYDEGVPGVGPKPEWHDNKTFGTLAAQARNQRDLRKKMATFEGAPEGYEINLSEELAEYEVNPDDPMIRGLQQFAKEKNMPQKYFDEAVNMIAKMSIEAEQEENETVQEYFKNEVKSLGSDGSKQVLDVLDFLKNTFEDFDPEKDQMLLNSAHAIRRFQALQKKLATKNLPVSPTSPSKLPIKSQSELDQMLNDPKYLTDPAYRKDVDDLWKAKLGEKKIIS